MEQIDRNSAPFSFLGLFRYLVRANYSWPGRLHVLSITVAALRPPFRLRFLCMERAAPFRSDGAERNENVTVFFTPTVKLTFGLVLEAQILATRIPSVGF